MKAKCSVCGNRFMLARTQVYRVTSPTTVLSQLVGTNETHDAIDCPRCGCQMILHNRWPKISEEE